MKKVKISFAVLVVFLAGIIAIIGCGQSTQEAATTTTTIASSIVLSGSLATGSISNSGVKASGVADNYDIIAIDNGTKKTYKAVADASGNFSLSVPGGSSYEVSLVNNSTSKYFGPIVMVGNASSSEVVMGVKPSTDTNFGQIVLDSAKGMAKPTSEPTSIANYTDLANATAGTPKGAGNYGKNILLSGSTREGSDMDKDGIPNIFDADEDGDQIRNGILNTPSFATVSSNTIETVNISSNIWASHGTTEEAKDRISMRIFVQAKTGHTSEIASAECIAVPSTIKDIATVFNASSLGSPLNYPAEGSLWKTASYKLYKTTTLSPEQWIISIIPRAIMSVGDTFTVRVYFTGGGYQDFYLTTSYVLTDWARVLSYNGTTLPTSEGTSAAPVTYNTASLEVVFSKPKDEDGNTISGLSYSIRYATCESSGGRYGVPSNVSEPSVTDSGAATLTYSVPTPTAGTYYITPVAESADGQRNGEETWFTKQ